MKGYIQRKIIQPILNYLKEGVSPVKIALCIAFGCVVGIIPFAGITTLLCAGIAITFRLNMAIIQIINYAVYPLQILLFIPFIKLGILTFGAEPLVYSSDQIVEMIKENAFQVIVKIGYANGLGLVIWLMISPLLFGVIYYSSKYLLEKYAKGVDLKSN